jgi:hypothetical protein
LVFYSVTPPHLFVLQIRRAHSASSPRC